MRYDIFPARPGDVAKLPALECRCARLFPPGHIPEHLLDETVSSEAFETARLENRLWIAAVNDEAVGFALFATMDGLAILAELDVLPEYGRKGIGGALLARVIEHAREAGFAELYLTTFSDIPWNAPFYAKRGFIVADEDTLPAPLRDILAEERGRGLPNRIAMQFHL